MSACVFDLSLGSLILFLKRGSSNFFSFLIGGPLFFFSFLMGVLYFHLVVSWFVHYFGSGPLLE